MDTLSIRKFIEKTIQKTKTSELSWTHPSKDFDFKPLPEDNVKNFAKVVDFNLNAFLPDYSYIAEYKSGYLTLMVYKRATTWIVNPPENCILSLRMQSTKSRYAAEITNSSCDSFDSAQLIRLYNLIDNDSSNVSRLIEDFLNS